MFGTFFWQGIAYCLGVVALICLWLCNWMVGSVCIVIVICAGRILRKLDEIIRLLKANDREKEQVLPDEGNLFVKDDC